MNTNKYVSFSALVYQMLKQVLILLLTTSSLERCFSIMNIVKNVLRHKMGEQFMSDCLICFVEKDTFSNITKDVVIDRFEKVKNQEGKL